MIEILDNRIPLMALRQFYDKVSSPMFPWYFSPVVENIGNVSEEEKKLNFQFAHTLYNNNVPRNEWFNSLSGILDFVPDYHSLVRLKINFNPCYSEVREHSYHVDVPFDCKTCIIYLNTNDGYTSFESGEKVESVEGRMVIFPSNLYHTGTTCTNASGRFVVNINYF